MLTDAQVYCMTSIIYLFRLPLTAKAIYRKTPNTSMSSLNRTNMSDLFFMSLGKDVVLSHLLNSFLSKIKLLFEKLKLFLIRKKSILIVLCFDA